MAESLDDGSVQGCGPPWPGSQANPSPNRDVLADSYNFDVPIAACQENVRFRAVVAVKGLPGAPPVSWATGSTDVSFTPKPAQELLPLPISDPSCPSPAPTMAAFTANVTGFGGPTRAQPFRPLPGGFTVNPPLSMTLSPAENLRIGLIWSVPVAKIATTFFLFPSTPVGGIKAAIVPGDSSYAWGGHRPPAGRRHRSVVRRSGWSVPGDCARVGALLRPAARQLRGAAGPYGGLPLSLTLSGILVFG